MKNLIFLLLLLAFCGNLKAQDGMKVSVFTLPNGLTVYLNEDHYQPNVFGAVIVKGGSKRDPADATGIAHYFEHIMFKGTDKLGTINYPAEKVYLDSISFMYDSLGRTKNQAQRQKIQIRINELSLKAGDYAIPNELDNLIDMIGGSKLNAGTNQDEILYFNQFPPEYINQWMEIYSERFTNPVFRLFQAELETVYEEKNMYEDNPGSAFLNDMLKKVFPTNPYGRQVIGETDHLKNPSLSKMREYFETYYVANNMALILVGNFNSSEIIPVIEEKFGKWRSGIIPTSPVKPEKPFHGREFVKKRMLPVPIGVIAYRGIPKGDDDEIPLEICSELLNNSASTGLLDKLYLDNEIMGANMGIMSYADDGALFIIFVPKILRQSLKNAEKKVMNEVEKVKKGEFSDTLFNTIKYTLKKNYEKQFENIMNRAFMINEAFIEGKDWNDYISYRQKLDRITKEDIIRVANKYLNGDRLVYYSKTGFPKKNKLKKPPYKPIVPKNSEQRSEYAKKIDSMPAKDVVPMFIRFGKDVRFRELSEKIHLYYTPNPYNRIFSLNIKFGVGSNQYPLLNYASEFMSLLGTESKSFLEFSKQMQAIGSSYYIYTSENEFCISISGFDENFDKTLTLMNELMNNMKGEKKHLEKFIDNEKADRKFFKADPSYISDALYNYALYKENSSYLRKLSMNQIKKLTIDTLLNVLKLAMQYEPDLFYAGTLPMDTVENLIRKDIHFTPVLRPSQALFERERKLPAENTVYYVPYKNAIQSQLVFLVEGNPTEETDRTFSQPFNQYFGNGMASLVFQEIREFRSLSYGAGGTYMNSRTLGKSGYFEGYMSTQADKTLEGISVYLYLIDSMPDKPERIEKIRNSLLKSFNDNRGLFRYLSGSVAYWRKQGYTDDPFLEIYPHWKMLNYDEIRAFYHKKLAGKPHTITIVSDPERVSDQDLKKFGKLIKLEEKDIYIK